MLIRFVFYLICIILYEFEELDVQEGYIADGYYVDELKLLVVRRVKDRLTQSGNKENTLDDLVDALNHYTSV